MSKSFVGVLQNVRNVCLNAREYLTDKELLAAAWFVLRADWRTGGSAFPGWRELAKICGLKGSDASRERSVKRIRAALVSSGFLIRSGTRMTKCGSGPRQYVTVHTVAGMIPRCATEDAGLPRDGVTRNDRRGDTDGGAGVAGLCHSKFASGSSSTGSFPRKPPPGGQTGATQARKEAPGIGSDGRRLDYNDLHVMGPIEAAARVTGELDPRGFQEAHRSWRKALRVIGVPSFRSILDSVHGESTSDGIRNPGAILAMRLKDAVAECGTRQRERKDKTAQRGAASAA